MNYMILALALNFSTLDLNSVTLPNSKNCLYYTVTHSALMCECIARQYPTLKDSYLNKNSGRQWQFHIMLTDDMIVEAPVMLAQIEADIRYVNMKQSYWIPATQKYRVVRRKYILENKPFEITETNSYWRIAKR